MWRMQVYDILQVYNIFYLEPRFKELAYGIFIPLLFITFS